MKILSQDKTKLIQALLLKVDKDSIGKNAKGIISAVYRADSFFTNSDIIIATFDKYDVAIQEFEKITDFFEQNPNSIYKFK